MAYLGFSQKLDCEIRFYVQVVYWGDKSRKVGKWGKEVKEAGPGFFIHRLTLCGQLGFHLDQDIW